jgi:hypothetical protein
LTNPATSAINPIRRTITPRIERQIDVNIVTVVFVLFGFLFNN